MKIVMEYEREDEKKHSVRFTEIGKINEDGTVDASFEALGTIYVRRESGLVTAKRLRITIEEVQS